MQARSSDTIINSTLSDQTNNDGCYIPALSACSGTAVGAGAGCIVGLNIESYTAPISCGAITGIFAAAGCLIGSCVGFFAAKPARMDGTERAPILASGAESQNENYSQLSPSNQSMM